MYLCLAVSLWITLPMSALAAGFLVRIFIRLCSLMTLTPHAFWRRQHARHHSSWNNLDRRAASRLDIYSSRVTVAEHRALGRSRRCLVRLANHPIVANLLLPPLVFVVLYGVPFDAAKGWRRERRGIYLTNLALAVFVGALGLALGYGRVAAVQLPIMVIVSIVGVWLFSIQHRFEHAQRMPDANWSYAAASLGGASYLRLPCFLPWFTGNIGFHHVHHVDPRIPNYRLEERHNGDAEFRSSPPTLRMALQALRYVSWDSDLERLVPFRLATAGSRCLRHINQHSGD
jgi:omega-6 fatty acid desaturase (delta-12 desaturase)